MFLEVAGATKKPVNPFKFNSCGLKDESFIKMVKEIWVPLGPIECVVI
jgi:hypothetical protein